MIDINKTIYYILMNDSTLTGLTTSIFPLIIPENTALPCIVYERQANVNYTKFGTVDFDNTIDITVLSDSYSNSIDIAKAIYNALNGYTGTINDTTIVDTRLNSINETFAEDSFIQKLTFSLKAGM
jgi:hypothetical protein